MCVIVSHFVLTVQIVAEILAFFYFFKMEAIRHIGFVQVKNINDPYGQDGQYASIHEIWC